MRRPALVAGLAAVVLAGCGGSHRSTSTGTGPTASTTTPGTSATTGATTTGGPGATTTGATNATTTGGTGTATTGTNATTTGGTGTTATTGTNATTTAPPPGGGPRLPATFTIGPGEAVNPPIVSGPSKVAVALTVVSADHRPHRVVVRIAPARVLRVPAGGRASLLLSGLVDGSYVLEIDGGRATATIQIGAQPGP